MNEAGDREQQFQSDPNAAVPEATPDAASPSASQDLPSEGSPTALAQNASEAGIAARSARERDGEIDSGWMGSLQSLMVTVVIAVFVITFIVQAFQIPSESMENTLLIGDYLLVDKAHYGPGHTSKGLLPYGPVERGDIIVFRYPIHPSQHFVKRVIGLPGDRVRLVRGKVFINNRPIDEPYAMHRFRSFDSFRDNFPVGEYLSPSVEARWYLQMRKLTDDGQLIVPQDNYFVLGDNRDDSLDSRYWGFVPRENIIGRPLLIYWSIAARDRDRPPAAQNGKLARFGQAVLTLFQNLRWARMMRLVH